jgi:hypothetical protein
VHADEKLSAFLRPGACRHQCILFKNLLAPRFRLAVADRRPSPAHHVSSDKGGWAPALFLHQVTLQDRHIRRVGHKHNREIAERQTGGEMGFGNRSAVRSRDDRRKRNIMGRRR